MPLLHSNSGAGAYVILNFVGGVAPDGNWYKALDFEEVGTSSASLSIGTGTKILNFQGSFSAVVGDWIHLSADADATGKTFMEGRVTSITATSVTINSVNTLGSGSYNLWTLNNVSFNPDEQERIIELWRSTSKYFSMFNIDVTTDYSLAGSKPTLMIGMENRGGGFSFTSFPSSTAVALASNRIGKSPTISHEAGHSFTLDHTALYNAFGFVSQEYADLSTPLNSAVMGGSSELARCLSGSIIRHIQQYGCAR